MVILILAVVWAVFLIPQALRARAESSPADSIGAFRRQLSVLERTGPAPTRSVARFPASPAVPNPYAVARPSAAVLNRSQARKRRRDILCGLLAAMGGSFVLGLIPPLRVMLSLHVLLDLLFIGYIALLIRARNAAMERDVKVRFLPTHSSEPALLLRRSAN